MYIYWRSDLFCKVAAFRYISRLKYLRNICYYLKIVWKHGPYWWCFHLNFKYLRWPYRAYIKAARNGDFCEEMPCENGFDAVLATFCCYDHGAKASEAIQKIATEQK